MQENMNVRKFSFNKFLVFNKVEVSSERGYGIFMLNFFKVPTYVKIALREITNGHVNNYFLNDCMKSPLISVTFSDFMKKNELSETV